MSLQTMIYAALILVLLYGLFTVGFPFLLAFLVAFLLEPLIKLLSTGLKIKRLYVSLMVCTVFTIVILTAGYFLVAKVLREATDLTATMLMSADYYTGQINSFIMQYQSLFSSLSPEYQSSILEFSNSLLASAKDLLGVAAGLLLGLARQIPNILIEVLIFFIAIYLISMRLPEMKRSFLRFFDPDAQKGIELVLNKLGDAILGFIRAQLFISFLIFCVVLLGFLILRIKYASALALLITAVDILPILGTGSVMIPMAVYFYLTGNIFLAVALLIHYGVIVVFRRIIEPKILSHTVGISALSALVSLYIGVQLTGFIGLFLGPAVVILFQAMIHAGVLKIRIKF